jgi:hypothetical protein
MRAVFVCVLVASAARADSVAYGDAKAVALKAPQGVACTAEGRVVVADTGNHRLVAYSFKDGILAPGAVFAFPELGSPSRVQIDSRGNVFALDSKTRRIVRVADDGRFGGFVTPKGLPAGKGYFPISFKLGPRDELFILDAASARVVVLDSAGVFQRSIPEPAAAGFDDIAVDTKGIVFAVDGRNGQVYSGSAVLASLKGLAAFASSIAVTAAGRLVLSDRHGHSLLTLGADGTFLGKRSSMGWSPGFLYYPEQFCLDAKGDLFIADRGNNRLQAFIPAQ